MANYVYPNGKRAMLGGTGGPINLLGDSLKVMLVNQTYRDLADKSAHAYYADISANEIAGTGYSAGGQALAGRAVASDGAAGFKISATNPAWAASSISSAWGCVVYKDTGNGATSPLVAFYDFGAAYTSTNDTFTITGFSTGFYTLS